MKPEAELSSQLKIVFHTDDRYLLDVLVLHENKIRVPKITNHSALDSTLKRRLLPHTAPTCNLRMPLTGRAARISKWVEKEQKYGCNLLMKRELNDSTI